MERLAESGIQKDNVATTMELLAKEVVTAEARFRKEEEDARRFGRDAVPVAIAAASAHGGETTGERPTKRSRNV